MDTLISFFRALIGDIDTSNQEYSDDRLLNILCVAAQQLISTIDFSADYTVDIDAQTITPDPTVASTLDNPFINLLLLKSACILYSYEARTASGRAYSVRDGAASIDGRSVVEGKLALMKDACAAYSRHELVYRSGTYPRGHAIVGPFDIYAVNTKTMR